MTGENSYLGQIGASSITIALLDDVNIGDEESFLLYLQVILSNDSNACLYLHQQYSVDYEASSVLFGVVAGQHAVSGCARHLVDTTRHGFHVCPYTEFKLHKQQDKEVGPCILGYDEQLSPFYKIIDSVVRARHGAKKHGSLASQMYEPNSQSLDAIPAFVVRASHELDTSDSALADQLTRSCTVSSRPARVTEHEVVSRSYSAVDSDDVRPNSSNSVLVTIPAGCGKTSLLLQLQRLYPSVLCGKHDSKMSKFFEVAAARSPCLVLLDDVDTMERAQDLCTYLDNRPEGVMVVATATNPRKLVPELRQAGRLSVDIVLQKPDRDSRRAILAAMLQDAELQCDSAAMEELVSRSEGASGLDLNHIVLLLLEDCDDSVSKDRALAAITRHKTALQEQGAPSASSVQENKTANSATGTSSKVEVLGYVDELHELDSYFRLALNYSDVYDRLEVPPPSRILLYGPSGCGKTWMVRALAARYSLAVRTVTRADVFSKYFGESECNLNNIFDKAMAAVPCILHFPGFDGLASVKGCDQHEVEARVVNLLKARLDGALKLKGLFIVAETSRPDLLDAAIVRRGRILAYLYVGLPDADTREAVIRQALAGLLLPDQCCRQLTELTEGYTVAEVQQVCRHLRQQDQCDVRAAIQRVQPGTSKSIMNIHVKFRRTYEGKEI